MHLVFPTEQRAFVREHGDDQNEEGHAHGGFRSTTIELLEIEGGADPDSQLYRLPTPPGGTVGNPRFRNKSVKPSRELAQLRVMTGGARAVRCHHLSRHSAPKYSWAVVGS